MEVIIQEGMNGTIFEDVESWELKEQKITKSFVVEVCKYGKVVGVVPYNVKTTVIIINYFEDFDNEPGQNTKR